jgi:hypothetical protein
MGEGLSSRDQWSGLQVMASRVTKNEEQVAQKVEQLIGSQPSGSGGKEQPSEFIQEKSWFMMAMQNAQGQEASSSIDNKYPKQGGT